MRLGARENITRASVLALVPPRHLMAEKLGRADVVCTTPQGSCHPALRKHGVVFLKVLFDEAGQSTEPNTLVPICHGADQVILVGDQKQLPAMVKADAARRLGMSFSMFERLLEKGLPATLLAVQYRMHPSIASFPFQHFYGGAVSNGLPASHFFMPTFPWPNPDIPVCVINVTGEEKRPLAPGNNGKSWKSKLRKHPTFF